MIRLLSISFTAFLLLSSSIADAQIPQVENLPAFHKRPFHFGIGLGINSANFILQHNLSNSDSLLRLEARRQSGFQIGIVSSARLTDLLTLRFTPTLAFGQRNLEYTFLEYEKPARTTVKPIESTWLDFPLAVKFNSARVNNYGMYLLGGGRYTLDLASQAHVDQSFTDDVIVKIKRHSYSWEIGFGVDFYLEYFKFSPEIRMVTGFNNLIVKDNTRFSNPIDKLNSQIFVFTLNFEG